MKKVVSLLIVDLFLFLLLLTAFPLAAQEATPVPTNPEQSAEIITATWVQIVGLLTVALTAIVGGVMSSPIVEPLTQVLKQWSLLKDVSPTGIALGIGVIIWTALQVAGFFGFGEPFMKWFGVLETVIPVLIATFGTTAGAHVIYQAASRRAMGFIGAPRN